VDELHPGQPARRTGRRQSHCSAHLTDIALESYRLGAITAVELRDVQLGHIAAEQRLITVRYEAKMAELQLKRLAGLLA